MRAAAVLVAGTASRESDRNVTIAAHRDGFLRALADAAAGDVVQVEGRSRRRLYRVAELLIVEPTDTNALRAAAGLPSLPGGFGLTHGRKSSGSGGGP